MVENFSKNGEVESQESESAAVVSETRREARDLRDKVSGKEKKEKDRAEFDRLSNDPDVKKGLLKILDKNAKNSFSEQWKNFEGMNVSSYIKNISTQYPEFLLITQDLGLSNVQNFASLPTESKLKFMALQGATQTKGSYDAVMKKYNRNLASYTESMNRSFQRKNITNFLMLEKTLAQDFGLTESETTKVSKYLQIIEKHPSYVGGLEVQEASIKSHVITLLIGIALGAVGAIWIGNSGSNKPDVMEVETGEYSITNKEQILQILCYQGDGEEKGGVYRIDAFKEGGGSGLAGKLARRLGADGVGDLLDGTVDGAKRLGNGFLSKEIEMTLRGKVKMSFDVKKYSKIEYNVREDGSNKGHYIVDVTVDLPEPDIIVTDDKIFFDRSSFEFVHFSKFEQGQETARQDLIRQLKEDAKNDPEFYKEGVNSIKKTVASMFETAYAPLMNGYGEHIVSVGTVTVNIQNPELNIPNSELNIPNPE